MNISWAKEIIHHLIMQGVDYFCLAPGSRITPLAIAIAEDPRARTFVHYDERGTSFHALGAAKGSRKPVAILTTSGTALGNIMPAVMEACMNRIPLILLTADRPPELRDTGANQTLDQVKLFTNYVRWQVDLPPPDTLLPDRFVATTIAQAVHLAQKVPEGPVHLNCMFREPFFQQEVPHSFKTPCYYEETTSTISEKILQEWALKLSQIERGIIIVGSYHGSHSRTPLIQLAEKLQWPLIADIDSGLRTYGRPHPLISYHDLIFKTDPDIQADAILHFGDRLVSKALLEWMGQNNFQFYCQVANHPFRADPKHCVTHRIPCDPSHFAEKITPLLSQKEGWLSAWKETERAIEEKLLIPDDEISEPGIVLWLEESLPPEFAFFFANGMPVRDGDSFFYPSTRKGPIFTSRGVSGIDGNIATVAGIAEGAKRPLAALIGDQTALHDLNSLSQLKKTSYPVILCIINNYGSGMFSFLPISQHAYPAVFEEFFAASHELCFAHAASLFNLPYYHPESWYELSEIPLTHSCIVEFTTNRARNFSLHQEILGRLHSVSNT